MSHAGPISEEQDDAPGRLPGRGTAGCGGGPRVGRRSVPNRLRSLIGAPSQRKRKESQNCRQRRSYEAIFENGGHGWGRAGGTATGAKPCREERPKPVMAPSRAEGPGVTARSRPDLPQLPDRKGTCAARCRHTGGDQPAGHPVRHRREIESSGPRADPGGGGLHEGHESLDLVVAQPQRLDERMSLCTGVMAGGAGHVFLAKAPGTGPYPKGASPCWPRREWRWPGEASALRTPSPARRGGSGRGGVRRHRGLETIPVAKVARHEAVHRWGEGSTEVDGLRLTLARALVQAERFDDATAILDEMIPRREADPDANGQLTEQARAVRERLESARR